MSKIIKHNFSTLLISEYADIFKCPICSRQMKLFDSRSLVCSDHHCFDLARQGYINLLPRPLKTKYDKRMFQSRNIICKSGFFEPLHKNISDIIFKAFPFQKQPLKILDAGCGEGSHLTHIGEKLKQKTGTSSFKVGVDISKEAMLIASKQSSDTVWCVADLAKTPFFPNQFNVILNILSPSNYSEFNRLLCENGLVIKVIPEQDHLKELRQCFYKNSTQQFYSNDRMTALFTKNLCLAETRHIQYTFLLERSCIEPLVYMTPLSWHIAKERLQKVLGMDKLEITVDLTLLAGTKGNHPQ